MADETQELRLILGLDERELMPYLDYIDQELSPEDCYEVRVSKSGEYIRIRREGKTIIDEEEIKRLLRERLLLE